MAKLAKSIVIVGAKRTAFGTMQGALKGISADRPRGARREGRARAVGRRARRDRPRHHRQRACRPAPTRSTARATSACKAGLPIDDARAHREPPLRLRLPGHHPAAREQLLLGEHDAVLVGGTENMTQAPHVLRGGREGCAFGKAPALEDSLWSALTDSYTGTPMAITAENLAAKYGITRARVRRVRARQPAALGRGATRRASSRTRSPPIELAEQEGAPRPFAVDEHPRPQTTLETLGKLPPVFKKDGVVTAGNASGICDGAACLVAHDRGVREGEGPEAARAPRAAGASPASTRRSWASARRRRSSNALARAGLEAVATSTSSRSTRRSRRSTSPCEKELGLPRDKTNVNGGAIALGHPLGACGARITAHLVYELARRGGRYARRQRVHRRRPGHRRRARSVCPSRAPPLASRASPGGDRPGVIRLRRPAPQTAPVSRLPRVRL